MVGQKARWVDAVGGVWEAHGLHEVQLVGEELEEQIWAGMKALLRASAALACEGRRMKLDQPHDQKRAAAQVLLLSRSQP